MPLPKQNITFSHEPTTDWHSKNLHPEDKEKVLSAIAEAISGKKIFELEHRVIRVDGTMGWTFSRAVPILDDKGEMIEWFGTATDNTDH
ncbi:PAS domain-containing protein [Mucilaginibacter sp. UYP25]|uniref:PAS domain-containing protein n=1 Tax=unclassified Mucilaginibacter TaxID=2617802 RepID=UPI0033986D5F